MNSAVDTPKGRYYPWKGKKYISVTTGLSEGVPKPGLARWHGKNVAEIASKSRKQLALMTQAQAKEWLIEQHFNHHSGSEAADLGSRVHYKCEQIAQGVPIEDDADTLPYTDAFRAFLIKHKPTFLENEVTVFSGAHGYAGTADAILTIRRKTYVVDIKTGKSVWPEAALQISAYRHAEFIGRSDGREDPVPDSNGGLVLHLRPEGFRVVPVSSGPEVFDTFLSALDMFRWTAVSGRAAIGEEW